MYNDDPKPYNSYGNGAAMRVSACGFAATSVDEAKSLAKAVTEVTHNHPEGLKGAEATVVAIYMARTGHNMDEICSVIDKVYYPMNFTLNEIHDISNSMRPVKTQYPKRSWHSLNQPALRTPFEGVRCLLVYDPQYV